MTFGEKLKNLRETAGMTQSQLAEKIKIPIHSIRNHEQDMREPAASLIYAYAKALGVDCRAFSDCEFVKKPQEAKPEVKKRGKK